jgi:hypothetical protein
MSLLDCTAGDKQNLFLSKCNKLPQMFRGMITTPMTFKLTPTNLLTASATKTALQNAILAAKGSRIYLWADFKSLEYVSEDAVYEETPLADMKVRDGKYRFRAGIKENLCLHKAQYSHNGGNQRVFFIDSDNNLFGTLDTDGNFMGFTVSLLNTEKLMISDGSVSTKSPVYIVLKNSKEIDVNGELVENASFVDELSRLTDVDIAIVGDPTDTVINFTVKQSCDGEDIVGFVAADFTITDNDNGASHAVGVLTYNATTKVYTLTGVAYEDSVLDLKAASALSIQAYESTGGAAVNVA